MTVSVTETELIGASSLLRKYLMLLCAHVADVLPIAASLATCSEKHFTLIAQIIAKDVSGKTWALCAGQLVVCISLCWCVVYVISCVIKLYHVCYVL